MKNVSDENCIDNQNTNFMFNNFVEIRAACEIMQKNNVEFTDDDTTHAH
jgi:hypothetical protein